MPSEYHEPGTPNRGNWDRILDLEGGEFLRALESLGRETDEDFAFELSPEGRLEAQFENWFRDELKARLEAHCGPQPVIEVDVLRGGEVVLSLPDGISIQVEDVVRAIQRELGSFQEWKCREERQ